MKIETVLRERILILDGAMGTKIQSLGLTAENYHQGQFAGWPVSLVGNNDVLCLTAPEVIRRIHEQYIFWLRQCFRLSEFPFPELQEHRLLQN